MGENDLILTIIVPIINTHSVIHSHLTFEYLMRVSREFVIKQLRMLSAKNFVHSSQNFIGKTNDLSRFRFLFSKCLFRTRCQNENCTNIFLAIIMDRGTTKNCFVYSTFNEQKLKEK